MKRLAIFAHYDPDGEVKRHVLFYLRALRAECETIAFVSTAELAAAELDKIREYCATVTLADNVGLDFRMWQRALPSLDLSGCDELLLVNSSVVGPVRPLRPIFQHMSHQSCDFWGMTDSFEVAWHLQSYFLVFKRAAFTSDRFRDFFRSVLPYRDKDQIIRSYELGLTRFLEEGGLVPAAFVPMGSWLTSAASRERLCQKRRNATISYPLQLLRAGMPLVKVQLLRDNPENVKLEPILRALEASGYDLSRSRY